MEGHIRKRGKRYYYSFEVAGIGGKRKRIERAGGRSRKEAAAALRGALTEYRNTGSMFNTAIAKRNDTSHLHIPRSCRSEKFTIQHRGFCLHKGKRRNNDV